MSRSNPAATLLFWAMMIVGGASLAAALWLPAWLELRHAQAADRAKTRLRDELREQVATLDAQREHLEIDPAYIERIARREFGVEHPGGETVPVRVIGATTSPVESGPTEPEWVTTLEHLTQTHPVVRLYVEEHTRLKVLGLSAALVLAAILFLARRPAVPEPEDESKTDAASA